MATTTPLPVITTPAPDRPPARSIWWLIGAGLLLSVMLYLPALLNPSHPDGLVQTLTGWQLGPHEPSFYAAWRDAGAMIRAGRLPLWQAATYQALLEGTAAPVLYPGSLIFYLFGATAFGLTHTSLMAVSGLTLAWRGRGRWLWLALTLIGIVVFSTLRLDYLATLAWFGPSLWLAEWKHRRLALILLPVPTAFIGLTAAGPVAFVLYALIIVWWLRRPGLRMVWRLALVLTALVGGLGLAGPQLFPRLTYLGPAYDPALSVFQQPAPVVSLPAQFINWQTSADGELTLRLNYPAATGPLMVRVTGRSNQTIAGWTSAFGRADTGKKGQEVRLSQGAPGELVAQVNFGPGTDGRGEWQLKLRYLPMSFTLGLYAAFLVVLSQGLLAVVVGWLRFYREDANDHPLRRVVKNSVTPLFAQLSGKLIDFTFAIFVLRLLGPDGNGQWTFATTTWLFFATISDFGLESLVTREIARARSLPDAQAQVNRLFVTKLFLRLGFSILSLPVALVWLSAVGLTGHLSAGSFWAVVVLMIGFWPSAVVGSITVVFRGYEKFEFQSVTQLLTSVIRVPLGLAALLLGWGVVGLGVVSLTLNVIQLFVMQSLMHRQFFKPQLSWRAFDWKFGRILLLQAYPLMLNGLIINVLFKSDGLILQPLKGDTELGLYNSAYKFVDALLIIPSALTLALFPLFSAYSTTQKENLQRAFHEGLRILTLIALPICVGTLFVAYDLIGFLGGPEFLPGGATALQILIWFLPFSYINGITQYVLIALDQQKEITKAVIVAAIANVSLNLLLIPFFGFAASAALTVLTELLLLVPFVRVTRRSLGPDAIPLVSLLWRPSLSALLMGAALGLLYLFGIHQFVVTVVAGIAVYLVGLALTRAVTRQDVALLKKVLRR